jgi:hypothetical protein
MKMLSIQELQTQPKPKQVAPSSSSSSSSTKKDEKPSSSSASRPRSRSPSKPERVRAFQGQQYECGVEFKYSGDDAKYMVTFRGADAPLTKSACAYDMDNVRPSHYTTCKKTSGKQSEVYKLCLVRKGYTAHALTKEECKTIDTRGKGKGQWARVNATLIAAALKASPINLLFMQRTEASGERRTDVKLYFLPDLISEDAGRVRKTACIRNSKSLYGGNCAKLADFLSSGLLRMDDKDAVHELLRKYDGIATRIMNAKVDERDELLPTLLDVSAVHILAAFHTLIKDSQRAMIPPLDASSSSSSGDTATNNGNDENDDDQESRSSSSSSSESSDDDSEKKKKKTKKTKPTPKKTQQRKQPKSEDDEGDDAAAAAAEADDAEETAKDWQKM